jgi:hypothetical protein
LEATEGENNSRKDRKDAKEEAGGLKSGISESGISKLFFASLRLCESISGK